MSDMPDVPPVATWSVGRQVATTGQLPDGTYGPGVSIPVKLDNGESITLFVPSAQYRDVATVKQLITDAVTHHMEIAGLSGQAY